MVNISESGLGNQKPQTTFFICIWSPNYSIPTQFMMGKNIPVLTEVCRYRVRKAKIQIK